MKKWIKFVGLLLLMLPVAGQAGDYTYTTNSGKITITDYTGSGGAVSIPSTINGLPVTSIGDYAFLSTTNLTSVIIPNSIISIGRSAFYSCTKLTSVTIPSSIASIGSTVFVGCNALSAITVDALNPFYSSADGVLFDKNQTKLIQYPKGKNSGNYTVPNGVTDIGNSAFYYCASITNIMIGTNVTSIGDSAFYLCTNLTAIIIPNSTTNIAGDAFDSCSGLTSVTFGDNVKNIGSFAFDSCIRLTSAIIPSNVTTIGSYAFNSCVSLTNVTVPASVTNMGDRPFYNCANLPAILVNTSNAFYSSVDGVLFNKSQTVLLQCPPGKAGYYTVPSSVTNIGYAFQSCGSLTSVMVPKSLTYIGAAFSYCSNLVSVYFQGNAPSTNSIVFSSTTNATIYYLPETSGWKNPWGGRPAVLWNPSYLLTVNSGTGGGLYTNLQRVGISANASATGKTFDRWSGATQYIASVTSSTTTAIMPATTTFDLPTSDTILTATYKDIYYGLAITNGSGGGLYTYQQPVIIVADAPAVGKTFDHWSGDTQYVTDVTSPATIVTMPAQAITLTATYKSVYYELAVTNGSGGGSYIYQQQVTITADEPSAGKTFDRWIGDTQYVASVTSLSTMVTMPPREATLTASYRDLYCTLTVESAHGAPTPDIGTNSYVWGSVVNCSVSAVVSEGLTNWICSGWTGTGDISASGDATSTGLIVLTNLNSSITWLWINYTLDDLRAENVTAAQRLGTKLVEIHYDINSTKTNSVNVSLSALNETGDVPCVAISGDVGSVAIGTGKTIIWDAGADWNGNLDNLTFQILGQDAQGASVSTPAGRVRIPAGENSGTDPDEGAYSIAITNSLFMDAGEVTKAQWDIVYSWAVTNGYSFANAGSGTATNHPVQTISWYDAAKWCNARSQIEGFIPCYNTNDWSCDFNGNGYRLPMSDEWQYAARGGLSGKRFPWGDTITHSNDNYYSDASYSYDVSTTRCFHPVYGAGTAPEGTGTTNGYGLYAVAGNVMEWCQDGSGSIRIVTGGSWDQYASEARCSYSSLAVPATFSEYNIGFRTVQRASSSVSAEAGSDVPVDTRDYQLIVSSAHGSPVPNIGTNLYAWQASVTCSVNSAVISGLTNWTSSGWSGSGSVSASGATSDAGAFVLTSLVSSIVWNWNTNYWVETVTSGEGQVTGGNRWALKGSDVTLSATPDSGWLFMDWSGDASGDYTATNIIIPMVRPVSITATFSDDADDDGLLNTNETALGTNPRNRDSDGDGMNDPQELIAGTSPTNNASVLSVQLSTDVSANQISWYGVSGRYYRLEYTDSLANDWTPKGTVITGANAQIMKLDISTDAGRFYRIRVSDSPIGL